MGKKKGKKSRKGKKQWRTNISTEDIEDFLDKSTRDALSGGSLSHLPTDSLVFLDNNSSSLDLGAKRKIEKKREKVLRVDSVLQRNPFVKPIPTSETRKSKFGKKTKKRKIKNPSLPEEENGLREEVIVSASSMVDLWEDEGESNDKAKRASKPSLIPAVEVEPPGCSYNPEFEAHQDSLAQAVAEEMQKFYQNELGPEPVPLIVPGQPIDEEDMYFLEADGGSDDDRNEENVNPDEDSAPEKRAANTKRVTQVELNKRARRKEEQKIEVEAKQKEAVLKEIDSLPDIIQEIAKEDEEKKKRHIRRMVAKQERLKARPPRLGKHKFEPAPAQVLLSEEITGSLRKLKGCCTLLRDRFKSIEKRGLIAPTSKTRRFG